MITRYPILDAKTNSPSLESGDRLTREEFHRRYERSPDIKRAELVEGVVYLSSPVRSTYHGFQHGQIVTWLGNYSVETPGVVMIDNSTVFLDEENEHQPDVYLRFISKALGKSAFDDDGYLVGPPEFVAEVAASSASYDLGPKFEAYRRNGVQEYLVWRVYDEAIDWFRLRDGKYVALTPNTQGVVQSEVFPGLWLDRAGMLGGDMRQVFAVLREGLATDEHRAFVERLSENA